MTEKTDSTLPKLIKLDYGVLAMLSQSKMSGYDITNRLKYFWNTSHSRIYPVLAKLEKHGLAEYTNIKQINKPDKKLYHITERGIESLKLWVNESTQPKSMKDEALLKFICINLFDKTFVQKLLKERIATIDTERQSMVKILDDLARDNETGDIFHMPMQMLSASILAYTDLEKSWCAWVAEMYQTDTLDIEKNSFLNYLKKHGFKN